MFPSPRSAVLGLPSSEKPWPGPNLLFIPQIMSLRLRDKCLSQVPQLDNNSAGAQFQVFRTPGLYYLPHAPPFSCKSTHVNEVISKELSYKMQNQKK